MARKTLFELPVFGWLIDAVGAYPVERGSSDRRALRRTVDLLVAGAAILIFPEGTRGAGRDVAEFQRGFRLIVERAHVPVLPVGIYGSHRMLPKRALFPRPTPLSLQIGRLIWPDEALSLGAEGLRQQVRALVHRAAARCGGPLPSESSGLPVPPGAPHG
jgi:1-acyl-sn-glycerol-3-phosphate acyltransferase